MMARLRRGTSPGMQKGGGEMGPVDRGDISTEEAVKMIQES